MRITDNMMLQSMTHYLNASRERLQRLQGQVAAGRRILRPEDDPAGTERALMLRSTMRAYESYRRSVDQGLARLTATEAALQSAIGALEQATLLTMRVHNDTVGDAEREAAAIEIEELLNSVVSAANTRHQGRYIFGGHLTDTEPFTLTSEPTTVTYNGDDGVIHLAVEPGHTIAVSFPGDTVFTDALEALINLANALRTPGADLSVNSSEVNAAMDTVLQILTTVGQRIRSLLDMDERLAELDVTMQEQASRLEDIDLAEAAIYLASEETAYHAIVQTAARIPRPLLIELIR